MIPDRLGHHESDAAADADLFGEQPVHDFPVGGHVALHDTEHIVDEAAGRSARDHLRHELHGPLEAIESCFLYPASLISTQTKVISETDRGSMRAW